MNGNKEAIISGFTNSDTLGIFNTTVNPSGNQQLFLIKLDSLNMLTSINKEGCNNATFIYSSAISKENDVYFCGEFNADSIVLGNNVVYNTSGIFDILLFKIGLYPLKIIDYTLENKLSLYPNPANHILHDYWGWEEFNNCEVLVFNSANQIVERIKNISENIINIETTKFVSEIYFISIYEKGQLIGVSRFTKF